MAFVTSEGLWFDELYIAMQSRMSFRELLQHLANEDVHPPLYPLLMLGWSRLVGSTGELSLRLPSALFGALSVAAVYALGQRMFGPATARLAAGWLAVNAFAIHYSQEARSYSLLLLLSTVAVLAWYQWARQAAPSLGDALLYGVAALLVAYTHLFGMLLVAFLGLTDLARVLRRRMPGRRLLGTYGGIALGMAPWGPCLWSQATRVQQGFWIPRPEVLFWVDYLRQYAGHALLGLAALGASALALWGAPRTRGAEEDAPSQGSPSLPWTRESAMLAWLLLWGVFLLGVPFVLSRVGQPILHAKSAIAVLAPMALLSARGMTRLPGAWSGAVAAVWAFGSLAVTTLGYRTYEREQWREMVTTVERERAPTDLVVAYHPRYDPSAFYRYYLDPATELVMLCCDSQETCAPGDAQLEALAAHHGAKQLWLLRMRAVAGALPPGLEHSWRVVESRRFNGGILQRLVQGGDGTARVEGAGSPSSPVLSGRCPHVLHWHPAAPRPRLSERRPTTGRAWPRRGLPR
ncbi:glycosyltransferase family 39 protein [Myxococcus sp. RHSTA-1-4]|uniref:glycosyltransferase family 39 protein n=1 Tax=Myxococcus sp. RHSTA-1-4 TaxID=2874601 RepID=UPI001CBD1AE1|nr:glycosyltransferase family 39 protein [Myxococcus sp. RHSTA-1-4]MBZ4419830.1 glycosyltransferase family 39 protein [Myxococcus sp. RHSTA-1-4]